MTFAAEALLDGEDEALTRKAVEMALAGDGTALRLCLDRIIPPRRERPVREANIGAAVPRRFRTRAALVRGAEMAESRGRTSGCVARRGPRLPRRSCVTTF